MESFAFLTPTVIQQNATEAGLDEPVIAQLVALAERISAEPALQRCAEQLHTQTYQRAEVSIEPTPETLLGAEADKLYLLLAVDAIRHLRTVYEQRGIPAARTREISSDVTIAARRFADWHGGKIGLEDWVLRYWFGPTVASGDLYRLGRLEFILQPFDGNLRLYRHQQSGRVQALAEEGVRFTADGYLPFVIGEKTRAHYNWRKTEEAEDGWTATLVEDATSVTGTPISPLGYALHTSQQLAKDEWALVLRNGDTVLDMHIPSFMPLQRALLHASFQQALDFFPRYHPERPFKAFACSSWLFNTQWVELLPATSNILDFQRQGYLFPLPSDGAEGMYFIFGKWLVDLAKAPQDTQLRRAVIQHIRSGGKLRSGGFLLLPEDVAKFGEEPYRQR